MGNKKTHIGDFISIRDCFGRLTWEKVEDSVFIEGREFYLVTLFRINYPTFWKAVDWKSGHCLAKGYDKHMCLLNLKKNFLRAQQEAEKVFGLFGWANDPREWAAED